MNTITVEHTISMGHRLPSYDGICASPHGHNVRVVAEFYVPALRFLDFKEAAKCLETLLQDLDHAMVLHEEDKAMVEFCEAHNFRYITLNVEPTTENIATWIFAELYKLDQLRVREVVVHETAKYSARCATPSEVVQRIR